MTSSRVPTSAVLFLGLLLAAPLASADQKDDTLKKAKAAEGSGDVVGARDAYCSLPADFNDAGTQCTIYKDLAAKALNKSHFNFAQGVTLLDAGKFDEAVAMFRNVKIGPDVDAAKQKLLDIPGLKAKAQEAANTATANAATENAMKAKFDQGMGYFGGNDYPNAEKTLSQVTAGSHLAEAQAALNKIRSYNAKMSEAQQDATARNYAAAVTAYGQAIAIVPNGPGNPQGAMADAVRMASSSAQPVNPPTTSTATVKPPTPVKQIDVTAYLGEAQKAIAKKDYKKARRFLSDVFAQDRNNQDAKDVLADLNTKDTAEAKASDEDTLLSDIVRTYYAGSYQDAEDRLKVYIYNNQGKKKGLANFYLGASMMTRYYLAGGTDDNLRREAKNKFKAAKDQPGFTAPEKFVSPKIMKAFTEAS